MNNKNNSLKSMSVHITHLCLDIPHEFFVEFQVVSFNAKSQVLASSEDWNPIPLKCFRKVSEKKKDRTELENNI